jgi:hypothetical protein
MPCEDHHPHCRRPWVPDLRLGVKEGEDRALRRHARTSPGLPMRAEALNPRGLRQAFGPGETPGKPEAFELERKFAAAATFQLSVGSQ